MNMSPADRRGSRLDWFQMEGGGGVCKRAEEAESNNRTKRCHFSPDLRKKRPLKKMAARAKKERREY